LPEERVNSLHVGMLALGDRPETDGEPGARVDMGCVHGDKRGESSKSGLV
jgi:hypothetical protein